ncbi:MAG: hypothetical protein M3O93_01230 [Chloroflexota bacterium]|nr:hypothetical protein [Chloroflexota bacterium]
MRSLNLVIPEDVAQQLQRLAERDFRRVRDEAALLLVEAVRRAAQDLAAASEHRSEPMDETPNAPKRQPGDA